MKHTINYQIHREDQENWANMFSILTLKKSNWFPREARYAVQLCSLSH